MSGDRIASASPPEADGSTSRVALWLREESLSALLGQLYLAIFLGRMISELPARRS